MRASSRFAWIPLLACVALPALAQSTYQYVYLISNFGEPWDASTNEDAMDDIFGSANWTTEYYETVDASSLFTSSTKFIFMEGGDTSFDSFSLFMTNNLQTISTWISNGGRLLIMAAPNDPLISADVTLPDSIVLNSDAFYASGATQAYPVDRTQTMFQSPFQTGSFFTGNYFAHGYFTGDNAIAIMQSDLNEVVLAEDQVGSGLMVMGGMTTDNFQLPQPQAHELLENILNYTATVSLQ